jgi:hypothetical protein
MKCRIQVIIEGVEKHIEQMKKNYNDEIQKQANIKKINEW